MTRLLLLGAGNIGAAIAHLFSESGDYEVTVADLTESRLAELPAGVHSTCLDVTDPRALRALMRGMDMVVSACPFHLSVPIAEAARELSLHYFDLTEDVVTARQVRRIAAGADTAFMPQCGLAPGFVSIAAYELVKQFDSLRRVRMRVGALPLFPSNALMYNLTWSTAGLINEYCNSCEVIHDGELREVLALEGYEQFSLDGVSYEAFHTSGGLGTLCETLLGRVETLNYKTIRYPGHCELIRFLCNDLQLRKRRKLFQDVLEHAVPVTLQDVVLVFITVSGHKAEKLVQESYSRKVYHGRVGALDLAAIQITTAAALCAVVDLQCAGRLPSKGFVKQEDVSLVDFMENRFGAYYGGEADDGHR
jgi:saccharopine dehydrogenase-like NADP-dependent oxidoreductase